MLWLTLILFVIFTGIAIWEFYEYEKHWGETQRDAEEEK